MLTPTAVLFPPFDPGEELPVADLDWATGIVRMFITYADWQALVHADRATLEEDDLYTLEALTHEVTHLLQLSTTGYAYDLSCQLFMSIAAAVRDHADLDSINDHRVAYVTQVEAAYDTLSRAGADGVSPITIIESAAFHAQKVTHYPGIGPQDYERLLDSEAPSPTYRLAYDVAAERLGADALEQFPHVANLALCVSHPEVAFPALLEAFRVGASRVDIESNHRLGIALLTERFGDMLLGSASDRLWSGHAHPILRRIVLAYNQLANEGRLMPITLTARGRIYDEELAQLMLGPILFTPTPQTGNVAPMWVPRHWTQTIEADPLLEPGTMRLLRATAELLLPEAELVEPAPLPAGRAAHLSEHNLPVQMRVWEFSRENRTPEVAAHFGMLIRELATDSPKTRTLRGTVGIAFPDREFPGDASPLADVHVQTFLRELFEHTPHLLYFLADAPPLAALNTAVAAFAPAALRFEGDRADLLITSEALTVIAVLVRNAVQFAREHGQEPTTVFGHLRPFDAATRAEIERVATEG